MFQIHYPFLDLFFFFMYFFFLKSFFFFSFSCNISLAVNDCTKLNQNKNKSPSAMDPFHGRYLGSDIVHSLTRLTWTLNGMEPSLMSLVTPVPFPALTSQNVNLEKGLLESD